MLVKLKLKVKKLNLNKNMFLCLKSLPCSIYHDHNQPEKNPQKSPNYSTIMDGSLTSDSDKVKCRGKTMDE